MSADAARQLVLLLALAFVVYLGIRRIQYRRSIRTWPMVPGVITSSRISLQGSTHVATVNYSYLVEGQNYSAWRSRPFILYGRAENWIKQYPKGTPVRIRYNRKKPIDSWLFDEDQPSVQA